MVSWSILINVHPFLTYNFYLQILYRWTFLQTNFVLHYVNKIICKHINYFAIVSVTFFFVYSHAKNITNFLTNLQLVNILHVLLSQKRILSRLNILDKKILQIKLIVISVDLLISVNISKHTTNFSKCTNICLVLKYIFIYYLNS